ncbi:MAG: SPOR domain-containing protein, partial [Alphaproteobacteria bacterium]|nr:SPOR domain-containing protein [Alphaproteobacteria bacterium]
MSYHDLTGETRGRPASEPAPRQIRQSAPAGSNLRGKLLGALVAVSAVAGFAGIAWYATNQGQKNSATVVPVIQADGSPVKVLPEKPGGMKVPNQDKLIYLQISPDTKKPETERVLPGTEKPMAKPKPSEPAPVPKTPKEPKATTVTQAPILPPKMAAPETPAEAAKAAESAKAKMADGVTAAAKKEAEGKQPTFDRDALKAAAAAAAEGGQDAAAKDGSKPAEQKKDAAKDSVGPAAGQLTKLEPSAKSKDAIAGGGGYRVQLGSSKLKDRAEAEARRLNNLHAAILGEARVAAVRADLGKRGVFYRLWAGPFAERSAADALCDKLKARKQGCLI